MLSQQPKKKIFVSKPGESQRRVFYIIIWHVTLLVRPELEKEEPFLAWTHLQSLQASQTHESWQWNPSPHKRAHQVQKDQFCLWWHWSTSSPTSNITPYALWTRSPLCRHVPGHHDKPKEHQQPLAKNRLYLTQFSLSFPPHMSILLLNNKPSCEIPMGGISFQLYHVSAPTAPQGAPQGLSLPPCACSILSVVATECGLFKI